MKGGLSKGDGATNARLAPGEYVVPLVWEDAIADAMFSSLAIHHTLPPPPPVTLSVVSTPNPYTTPLALRLVDEPVWSERLGTDVRDRLAAALEAASDAAGCFPCDLALTATDDPSRRLPHYGIDVTFALREDADAPGDLTTALEIIRTTLATATLPNGVTLTVTGRFAL